MSDKSEKTIEWAREVGDLSAFFSRSPDAIFVVDPTYKFIFLSDLALQVLDLESRSVASRLDVTTAVGSVLEVEFRKVFSTKEYHRAEHEIHTKSGLKVFDAEYRRVEDSHGETLGVMAVLRDASQRRERERALEEAKARYEAQTRALDVFDIVAETDRRGQIIFANDRFVEISKYTRQELLGQDHRIVNSGFHPKGFFREMWATISRGMVWSGEICNRAKDGSIYWVSTVITPVFNSKGSIQSFLAIRRDITDAKKYEETLKVSELRLRELLEKVKLVAVSLDLKGRITFANRALLDTLGFQLEELMGMDWFLKFTPEDRRQELIEVFSQTLIEPSSPREIESELITKNGERRLIAWKNTVFKNLTGDVLGITSLGEDITERRKQEQRAENLRLQTERQREEIMGFVSHELRSPLMSIVMNVDGLKSANADERSHLERAILDEVKRIDRISKDFMQSCVNRVGELQFEFKPTHLNRLLDRVCRRFQDQLKASPKISLQLNSPEAEVVGVWDSARLDQVLSNLISNGIKYSKPEGGEIRVKFWIERDLVRISVSDEGVGIPKENIENIFELFSRGNNVKSSKTQGFGLGLKISRDIVACHGGKIWVESQLNLGSNFNIQLPFTPPALAVEAR